MKVRSMVITGSMAGALLFGSAFAANAGTNTGSCSNTQNGGASVSPVADPTGQTPIVYANGSPGPPPAGDAGVGGSGGYLEAGGSTSGGYVSGNNSGGVGPAPASGLNGTLTISSTPGVCVGVAGKGGVGAP